MICAWVVLGFGALGSLLACRAIAVVAGSQSANDAFWRGVGTAFRAGLELVVCGRVLGWW